MDGGHHDHDESRDDTLGIQGYSGAAPIGHGGFGLVFKASQLAFDREVAVKVLAAPLKDESVKKRFERECKAIGALSGHPHIVTVYESGVDDLGRPFIAMDFMPGGSFADYVICNGPLPWQDVVAMGVKLAGAVATAHGAGILHRDIKPENILLSGYGEPKLADFGISTVPGAYQTHSGVITASLTHAAPEILSAEPATESSDVYSLASTLFFLLRGTPPFSLEEDEALPSLIARILTRPVPDLRRRGVPDAVCRVLERALAKGPNARHASAEELARSLQDLQRVAGIPVTDVPIVSERVWVQGADAGSRVESAQGKEPPHLAGVSSPNETRHRRRRELDAGPLVARRRSLLGRPLVRSAVGIAALFALGGAMFVGRELIASERAIRPAGARAQATPSPSPAPDKVRATPRPDEDKPKTKPKPEKKRGGDKRRRHANAPQPRVRSQSQTRSGGGSVPSLPTSVPQGPINPPTVPPTKAPPPPKPTFVPEPPTNQPVPQQPLPSSVPGLPAG